MCILCTPQIISVDISANVLVGKSADCQAMCRATYRLILSWYNDLCQSTYQPMYQPRYQEWWSTYRPIIGRYLGQYRGRHADHWLSAEYWSTVGGISVKSLDCQCQMYKLYAFHPFLVNLKNFWRLHDTSQSTYWPTLDQFVGWHSADMSTYTLVECQLICWPIYRLRGAQNTHDLYPLSFMQ